MRRNRVRVCRVAAAIFVFGSVGLTAPARAATAEAPTNYLRVFTAQNISTTKKSFTDDEAKAVATNFDLLVASPSAFKGQLPMVPAVDPRPPVIDHVTAASVAHPRGPHSCPYMVSGGLTAGDT